MGFMYEVLIFVDFANTSAVCSVLSYFHSRYLSYCVYELKLFVPVLIAMKLVRKRILRGKE